MPVNKTLKFQEIRDEEIAINGPVDEETLLKLTRNCNMLSALAKVGSIQHIQKQIPNLPTVNSTIWKFCDGSNVVDGTSIFNGLPSRNLGGRCLKGAPNTSTNNFGGISSLNLTHKHPTGAASGVVTPTGQEGSERHTYNSHVHGDGFTTTDLVDPIPVDHRHVKIGAYLKIN